MGSDYLGLFGCKSPFLWVIRLFGGNQPYMGDLQPFLWWWRSLSCLPSLFLLAGLQSAITPKRSFRSSWILVCELRRPIGTDCNWSSPAPSLFLLAGLQTAITQVPYMLSSPNLVCGLRRPIGTETVIDLAQPHLSSNWLGFNQL